ncbi:MAG: hypothetical protein L7H13_06550 [Sulfolobales archaeon]|nr:hypothetical protein [Sulfolobales archaeon]
MKIHSVSIFFFAHETEDSSKILDSVVKCIPGLSLNDFSAEFLEGHHGNRIGLFRASVTSPRAREVFQGTIRSMDKADIVYLLSTLDNRLEKNRLHIRVDKQALIAECKPRIKDGDDVVKIQVSLAATKDELKAELSKIAQDG